MQIGRRTSMRTTLDIDRDLLDPLPGPDDPRAVPRRAIRRIALDFSSQEQERRMGLPAGVGNNLPLAPPPPRHKL